MSELERLRQLEEELTDEYEQTRDPEVFADLLDIGFKRAQMEAQEES